MLIRGALATRAVAVVAELGVADALAGGPRPVEELATEVGADASMLERYLRALASEGVFAEERCGVFRNTTASELLREGWGDFARLCGGLWYGPIGDLGPTPEPFLDYRLGTDFWSWLREHPVERAMFDHAMEQGKNGRIERLAGLEWRGDELVVDVGGGNGTLLLGLLERHSALRGIVFDLPEATRDESVFGDRCSFVAGDFFERVPAGDVHLLSTILHGWDDDRAGAILRTIRAAARADGRLILLEAVVLPDDEPHGAKWLDLLLSLTGGRERLEEEWRGLLASAGWEPARIEDGLIEATCR
jgi:hypothetical protein